MVELAHLAFTTWDLQAMRRELGVPGLCKHWSNLSRQAVRAGWPREANPRRRNGYLYRVSALPAESQAWIAEHRTRLLGWLATRRLLPIEAFDAPPVSVPVTFTERSEPLPARPDVAMPTPAPVLEPAPAPRRRRCKIEMDPVLHELVVGILVRAGGRRPAAARVCEEVQAKLGRTVPLRSMQWFIKSWEDRDPVLVESIRNPDRYKNRFLPAGGDMSQQAEGLNDLWELDSTPADVMLAEGRHAVIGCLDVWSRRVKLLVVKSSRAAAIGLLMRRAMLDWGVPNRIKTDNGQDFRSRHLMRVCQELGIGQEFCDPYSGWQKPFVERVLGRFNHDLVAELPSYLGASVAQREALRSAQSFAERLTKKGEVVELPLTAAQFQAFADTWCEARYGQQTHGTLGTSPFLKAQSWTRPVRKVPDERALDVLLLEAPDGDGTRVVGKKGLRIGGHNYVHMKLGPLMGRRVAVRHDPANAGVVFVFDEGSGAHICIAEAPELMGIPLALARERRRELAIAFRRAHSVDLSRRRKELRRLGRQAGDKPGVMLLERSRQASASVVALPKAAVTHTTPALEAAAEAARAAERRANPAPIERDPEMFQRMFGPKPKPEPRTAADGRPLDAEDHVLARWLIDNPDKCNDGHRRWLADELKSKAFQFLVQRKPEQWAWIYGEPEKKTAAG